MIAIRDNVSNICLRRRTTLSDLSTGIKIAEIEGTKMPHAIANSNSDLTIIS